MDAFTTKWCSEKKFNVPQVYSLKEVTAYIYSKFDFLPGTKPKIRNHKPTCTVTGSIINFICRASIWTQNSREWWRVPKSQNPTTSFGRTESLWQMNDRRTHQFLYNKKDIKLRLCYGLGMDMVHPDFPFQSNQVFDWPVLHFSSLGVAILNKV